MKHGSRLLFAIALFTFVVGIAETMLTFRGLEPNNAVKIDWVAFTLRLFFTMTYAILPFFAAVAINRCDLWLGAAGKLEDED
jgi:hypothetical protein